MALHRKNDGGTSTRRDIDLRVKVQKTKDINDNDINENFNNRLKIGKVFRLNKDENCHEYILKLYGDGLGNEISNFSSLYFQKLQ